jgi:hypothetical protein
VHGSEAKEEERKEAADFSPTLGDKVFGKTDATTGCVVIFG